MSGISTAMLKKVSLEIVTPLVHIFNQSLATGQIPEKFKIAKVIPIFKSGDALNPSNYRPISLLSTFSKILEKIVYTRLYSYLSTTTTPMRMLHAESLNSLGSYQLMKCQQSNT
jgi:hypothetical protein